MSTALEAILKRDRWIVAVALVLVSLLAWAWVLSGAGMGMDAFEMTRHSRMSMDMMDSPQWNMSYIILMFFMWWIMMIAMMLPSATPTILLAAALNRRSSASQPPFGPTSLFVGLLTQLGRIQQYRCRSPVVDAAKRLVKQHACRSEPSHQRFIIAKRRLMAIQRMETCLFKTL